MKFFEKINKKAVAAGFTEDVNKKILLAAAFSLGLGAMLTPEIAMAQLVSSSGGKSLGTIASNITNSLKGVAGLVTAVAYLAALLFSLIGAFKWKAYGEQPDRTPLKVPITYWGIAAVCAALPEFIGTGIITMWGSGARTVPSI